MEPSRNRIIHIVLTAICTSFFMAVPIVGTAQNDPGEIAVVVTLDHPDWNYRVNEKATLTITVTKGKKALAGAPVHVEIAEEKLPAMIVTDTVLKNGVLTIPAGSLNKPGFLRCTATTQVGGKRYRGLATAAFSPDAINATAELPADFLSFWNGAITMARKTPLAPKMQRLNERCTESINVYEISFQNERSGSRIYGILSTPTGQGRYPAVLKLPGAGVRAYRGDTALAEKGIVTLEIGIHGIPVTQPNEVYFNLAFGALRDYYTFNLDSRDDYYYKRVYLGCLRAVDYLLSLPQVDSTRIAVNGGSQGGALSIVTAALHPAVKYLVALYPALSDMTGYFHQRAGGWPHLFSPSAPAFLKTREKTATAGYYDAVNFARLLTVPGWYSWGYNDEVCPATTSFAVYNTIQAPKEKLIVKESGHWMVPQQADALNAWLLHRLQGGRVP